MKTAYFAGSAVAILLVASAALGIGHYAGYIGGDAGCPLSRLTGSCCGKQSQPAATSPCCQPTSGCCTETAPSAKADCCFPGSDCCYPGSPCCEGGCCATATPSDSCQQAVVATVAARRKACCGE